MIDHSLAIKTFEEIQARPFGISLDSKTPCNNCFYKGKELLERLGILGYTVRGRISETYWDEKIFDKQITSLLPEDILVTHFFVEIYEDGVWRALDPSYQPSLEKYGLTIGSWNNGKTCFPITKLYTQEESIEYQKQWFSPENDFFERGLPCWKALQKWFKDHSE